LSSTSTALTLDGELSRFGRFNDQTGCFELTSEPPRKWRNIHYSRPDPFGREIYAETSNIGDGPIRILEPDGVIIRLSSYDQRYLYVRDDESNETFNPGGAPCDDLPMDRTVTHFHPAYTLTTGEAIGLETSQRSFVPAHEPLQLVTATVRNRSDRPRQVSLFMYTMFQMNGSDQEGKGVGKDNLAHVHSEIGGVIVRNRELELPSDRFNGYLIALNDFAGANGYRDHFTRSDFGYGTPRIRHGWNCDGRPAYGPDCAGIVQVRLSLAPAGQDGDTGRADFVIGSCANPEEVAELRGRLTPEQIDQWCEKQVAIERDHAQRFTVDLGPEHADRAALINLFAKKQMSSYLVDKSGFRDNLQVDCGIALYDYPTARTNLLRALQCQSPDGKCLHSWRPLNRLQYADKPGWISLTVPWLIKESGDFDLLNEQVPYFESEESGSVWDHLIHSLEWLAHDTGKRGLCRNHFADWNDGLEPSEATGERESVMVTQQLCFGLVEGIELANRIGDTATAEKFTEWHKTFTDRLNDVAWDGNWYVRIICEDGYALGSEACEQSKIFLNTQSWAVLSQTATGERATRCMDAVEQRLVRDVGLCLNDPPMTKFDPRVGRFSTIMPGHATNGGCYNHAAGFKAVADCMLGRAEEAWQTYIKVAPGNPQNPLSRSGAEPFSFQNMYETVPEIYGSAGYPWRTGTAPWFTMALVEWILGARRHYDGLLIDPCLSKSLPRARVRRSFRGAVYDIELDNSAGRCTGAQSITVDGEKVDGNVLPVFDGGEHVVKVVI
jgi:cellobiose phosphorylase